MIIYFEVFCFGRSALFQVMEDKFQGWCMKLTGWREKRIFYQTLDYANIMMVDYCFYRVKPTAVILCSYFPFSLLMCCDFNLIAFLYWLTTALIYAFVETLDLYIVGFWKKTNKQKRQFYVTALFPMLRYNKGVVCILLQLNPSRHFNVCFKHCQKPRQLICHCRQSYTGATLLNSWQKAVCMCVCFFYSFDFLKQLFYGYYCTSKDF